jgi:hypothetical protein
MRRAAPSACVARLGVAVSALVPGIAAADTPVDKPTAIDVDRWVPSATNWWAGLDDARTVGLGHLAVGMTTSVIGRPIGLTSATGTDLGAPVERRATVALAAAYGVTDTVAIAASMPVVIQNGDRLTAVGQPTPLRRATTGDLRIGAKLQVVDRTRLRVAIAADLVLPTGNERHYAGEESWILHWRGLAGVQLGPLGVAAAAGVRLRGAEVAVSPEQVAGNEVVGGLAVSFTLPTITGVYCSWTQLRAIAELDGVLGDTVGGKRSPSPIEARLGVRGRIWRGWTIGVTAGRGLNDEVGAPRWRGVLDVAWRDEPRTETPVKRRDVDELDCVDDDC